MLRTLEMRIRIEEEDLGQLMFGKEIGQILHGVRPQAGDVPVLLGMQMAQRLDPVHYVVGYLDADLHADGELVRKQFTEFD